MGRRCGLASRTAHAQLDPTPAGVPRVIGTKLADRYEIAAEIGRGGMGVVYRAHDPRLGRDVAVKLVPPTQLSPDAEHRFQREAQVVAQMDHPAIVSIYDFGLHEGSLFFVMPLVQGTNFRAFLRKEDARLGDVLDVGIQVAEALEYSHARGVVHRDIKPENIMVTREEGAGIRVRVMDFGLARASTESRLTRTGTLVGTLAYLSPEQVAAKDVDGRSDIYALGTVLYECVAGSPPFAGEAQSVLYRIVHEFPQPPRSLGAEIDEVLEGIILSCLHKEPSRRPARAGEVAEELKRYRSRLRDSERERTVAGMTQSLQAPRPALAPFIGRTKELQELQQRLNAAVAGECQFVVVAGEPGVGKTRLLEELGSLARARQIRVLRGQSVEQDRAFPYQGFCEVIQEYFRSKETASSPPPDFSDLAADLTALFPMLSEIAEIRQSAAGDATLARGASAGAEGRTQIFELLARTLIRIAGGRPLVLFLEDLQQAEVSLEALQYIVRRLGPTPTLIVGTYRSTDVDARHPLTRMLESFRGNRRFASMALGPLSPSEHRSLLETLVGAGISDSLVKRLYEGTEGNPFFTKELVRSLIDSGGIARDNTGEWNLSAEAGLSAEALPATIQQAVEKRIERLPEELREVLATAALIGKTFDARDLEALAEGGGVDEALDRLMSEGLIEEERESRGDVLTFSSGVVRDVLYAGLSRRRRRSLHRRYAELLEQRHAGRLERVLPQLLHHFFQGDVPEKTVEYGLREARASLEAFSAEEAARAAKTALEFLDKEWEGERALEGDVRVLLARAHRMSGDIEGALREATTAVRVFEQEKQPARAAGALLLAAETAWQARRSEEATRWVARGLGSARSAGETETQRLLLSLGATLANLRGEYEKANEYLEEATRLGAGVKEAEREEKVPSGGRLVVALANPVQAREPAAIQTIEEEEVLAGVFETLLASDAQGRVVPALAASWEAGGGGRSFVFRLREGVRFQDGQPLQAADVKASFERSVRESPRDLPAAFAAIQGVSEFIEKKTPGLSGVVVRSDHEIEIRLDEPLPIYPAFLSHQRTAIAREASIDGSSRIVIVGTGPFRFATHELGRVVLERNPECWRSGLPHLDAVEFRPSMSAAAIARGLRSGEIDLARDLLPQDLEETLRDARFRPGLAEAAKRNTYFALFNCRSGAAAGSESLRRALFGVVRARDLVWRTLGRFAEPAVCLIPPGMLGHDPGRRTPSLTREEAQEILRAGGVATPLTLKAAVHPLLQDRFGSLLTALLSLWSELGVEVKVETPEMAQFLRAFEASEGFDLWIGRWNADYDDPDNFTHGLFHSAAGQCRSWFSSPESDRILEEARVEPRPAVRETEYRKFEGLLLEKAALVPLFHDIDYRLASPKVRGLVLRGTAPWVDYANLGKAEAAEPAKEVRWGGGVIHVPIAGVVGSLDPVRASTWEEVEVLTPAFECLTRDAGGARFVPWLAAEMGVDDGGRVYRFRLRDDVRFHDGRRLGARDVRYTFERLIQSGAAETPWLFASIRGARRLIQGEAKDLAGLRIHSATELTIELEEPVAFFPALLAFPPASIIPEGSAPSTTPESCVGTGPFRVVAFEPGQRLELARNPSYWRKGYPRSEGLVFSFGVSPKEILSGFQAGRFALASDLLPADAEALRREPDLAAGYRETPRLTTYFVAFNAHRGPFADRALRQRLVRAVDVPKLVRQTLGRLALPTSSLIPPGLLGHEPLPRTDSGPAAAPERLPAPIELTAVVHPVFFGGYSALARELQSALGEIGVKTRVLNQTIDEYLELMTAGGSDLVVGRWNADYPDADTFVNILHSRGFVGQYSGSAEVDRLVERGRTETSPAVRHSLYRQVEEIVAREALLLPLFHEQAYRFARPAVEGLTVSFASPTVAYENLRIRG